MQLLPTLSRIEEGEIIFYKDDKKINIEKLARNGKEMRNIRGSDIAMIFQEPMTSLNPVLTIGYQIQEAIEVHENLSKVELNNRVEELLDIVGIPTERVNSYPDELSGGQRQRVMIAMALANEPELLIADEPTTALDVTREAQILYLLADLQRIEGLCLLFVSHDFRRSVLHFFARHPF